MTADAFHRGGCHCGNIRFAYKNEPAIQGVCHCRLCQKSTASPFFAGLVVAEMDFELLQGAPRVYASSDLGQRSFCADCGSQLFFQRQDRPGYLTILVGTLDDAMAFEAVSHIWCDSQIPWLKIEDRAEKFGASRPPGQPLPKSGGA